MYIRTRLHTCLFFSATTVCPDLPCGIRWCLQRLQRAFGSRSGLLQAADGTGAGGSGLARRSFSCVATYVCTCDQRKEHAKDIDYRTGGKERQTRWEGFVAGACCVTTPFVAVHTYIHTGRCGAHAFGGLSAREARRLLTRMYEYGCGLLDFHYALPSMTLDHGFWVSTPPRLRLSLPTCQLTR